MCSPRRVAVGPGERSSSQPADCTPLTVEGSTQPCPSPFSAGGERGQDRPGDQLLNVHTARSLKLAAWGSRAPSASRLPPWTLWPGSPGSTVPTDRLWSGRGRTREDREGSRGPLPALDGQVEAASPSRKETLRSDLPGKEVLRGPQSYFFKAFGKRVLLPGARSASRPWALSLGPSPFS